MTFAFLLGKIKMGQFKDYLYFPKIVTGRAYNNKELLDYHGKLIIHVEHHPSTNLVYSSMGLSILGTQ